MSAARRPNSRLKIEYKSLLRERTNDSIIIGTIYKISVLSKNFSVMLVSINLYRIFLNNQRLIFNGIICIADGRRLRGPGIPRRSCLIQHKNAADTTVRSVVHTDRTWHTQNCSNGW